MPLVAEFRGHGGSDSPLPVGLLIVCLLHLSACQTGTGLLASRKCPAYSDLEKGLVAVVELPSTDLVVGEEYAVLLKLVNAGQQPLRFCLDAGPSYGVRLASGRVFPLFWSGTTFDALCAEEVHLQAGESRTEALDLQVPSAVLEGVGLVSWYSVSGMPGCSSRGQGTLKITSSTPVAVRGYS